MYFRDLLYHFVKYHQNIEAEWKKMNKLRVNIESFIEINMFSLDIFSFPAFKV